MGDLPTPTPGLNHPLVVSSTAQKHDSSSGPQEYHIQSRQGSHSNSLSTHYGASGMNAVLLPHPGSSHPSLRVIATPSTPALETQQSICLNTPTIQNFPGMASPSFQPDFPQHYGFSPAVFSQPMGPHSYQLQSIPAVTHYYPAPGSQNSPVYYSPQGHPYGQNSTSIPQTPQQGAYSYFLGYPHSYPQTPAATPLDPGSNTPQSHPQLQNSQWPGQQQIYYTTTSPIHRSASQPMSFPLQVLSVPQQCAAGLPTYGRRHSLPLRNMPTRQGGSQINVARISGAAHTDSREVEFGRYESVSAPSIQTNAHSLSPTSRIRPEQPIAPIDTTFSPVTTNLLRGPPRKPRQSGHALWVGNLPSGSNVIELKDYFSRGASKDIESVFLISKSNCAFINYKTNTACNEAMVRFHDSRFKGVRLVCRLRRHSSVSGSVALKENPTVENADLKGDNECAVGGIPGGEINSIKSHEGPEAMEEDTIKRMKDRFFILKSLTTEDLDLSVRNGVWATQSHNEKALNCAFETSENTYLIFSANKSGEYYGYARMTSKIPEKSEDEIEAKSDNPENMRQGWSLGMGSTLPQTLPLKTIYTTATASAPEGRVIDDSERGTIFWESIAPDTTQDASSDRQDDTEELSNRTRSWSKPFNIQWISTTKLPFYKTRGLRNSWNSNREVKIARDGTEVEETVGKKLIQLFHRGEEGNIPVLN